MTKEKKNVIMEKISAGGIITEPVLDIYVKITGEEKVKGKHSSVTMAFFEGYVRGKYFNGKILEGGIDTQKSDSEGNYLLSARYMLEGTDFTGKKCRIFIENSGNHITGYRPLAVTDSEALSFLESSELSAEISPSGENINVKIYRSGGI